MEKDFDQAAYSAVNGATFVVSRITPGFATEDALFREARLEALWIVRREILDVIWLESIGIPETGRDLFSAVGKI